MTQLDPLDLMASLVTEAGQPWGAVASDFQWSMARSVLDPEAPPYRWESRPRGGSKTTDAAGIALVLLLTQLPAGSASYAFASDKDQAKLLLDALRGFVARTPALRDLVEMANYRVTSAGGATLEVLPADASSVWGIRPHLMIADEVCQWPGTNNARNLWEAAYSSLAKVPGSRLICITTSGDPAHWSHTLYGNATQSDLWTVADVPGPLPWVDPIRLAEQRAMLPDSVYRRLHLNAWSAGEDRLVSPKDLAACVVLDGPQPPLVDVRYLIGLDVGLKRDRTAAAVCHQEGERIVLDHIETWQGSRLRPVRLGEVESWLQETSAHYGRAPVILDPWQSVGMAQRLREGGHAVEEYPFTPQSVGRLASALHVALRNHQLALPDDPELLDELANVRLKETSVGVFRLDHDSGHHDDRAVALALVVEHFNTSDVMARPILYDDAPQQGPVAVESGWSLIGGMFISPNAATPFSGELGEALGTRGVVRIPTVPTPALGYHESAFSLFRASFYPYALA